MAVPVENNNRSGQMELKQVILELGPEWRAQTRALRRKLEASGICCARLPAGKSGKEKFLVSESLAVTDDRALAAVLAGKGVVCVGCAPAESSYFEGAALVTDAPEQLDALTLNECLLRASGRPVLIAETQRLVIREITEQDIRELYQISRQEGMQRAMAEDCLTPERLAAYIKYAYRLNGYGLWSVLLKNGTLIGCCGFADAEARKQVQEDDDRGRAQDRQESRDEPGGPGSGRGQDRQESRDEPGGPGSGKEQERLPGMCLELQYMTACQFQRRGYGEEMCRAALDYAHSRLGTDEIWIQVDKENSASRGLAEKLGFCPVYTDQCGFLYLKWDRQKFLE